VEQLLGNFVAKIDRRISVEGDEGLDETRMESGAILRQGFGRPVGEADLRMDEGPAGREKGRCKPADQLVLAKVGRPRLKRTIDQE